MKVVVTGGTGKLGWYVVNALTDCVGGRSAHDVIVLDRTAGPVPAGVRLIICDVLDLGQVIGAAKGADAIIHLAGIPHPWTMPDEVVFRTNSVATFNIHQAAALLGIKRVVSASSEAALGWTYRREDFLPDYLPVDENHPARAQDPYGLSKVVGEAIARSFSDGFGMETVAIRPPWVCTPEELEGLRSAGGRTVTGFQLFNYVDVRDLAEAFRLAVERPLKGHHIIQVANDDSSVAEPLCILLPRLYPQIAGLAKGLEGPTAAVSNAKAKSLLGWKPRFSWRQK